MGIAAAMARASLQRSLGWGAARQLRPGLLGLGGLSLWLLSLGMVSSPTAAAAQLSLERSRASFPNGDPIWQLRLIEGPKLVRSWQAAAGAANRQRLSSGVILKDGEMDAAGFFKRYLSRLHLVTTKFEVWDYMIGQQFGDNYFHCLKWWVGFLSEAEEQIEFVIHTEGNQTHAIQQRLDSLCEGTCISPSVKQHDHLPHERYLLTKAFDFDLGRGIDLFNPTTGRNRDIRVAISPRLRV
jgi:hypothetical protein